MPANTSSKKKFGSDGDKSSGGKRKFDGGNNASAAGDGGGGDQSASNKKRALKHERQSHRRHADAVVASKEIWNKLRLKTNTKKETREMTDELMELLRGKFAQVAMQHDASRVVQAVLQYGTPQQRLDVVKELADADVAGSGKKASSTNSLAELCKIQYAHFAVLKIIKYCYKEKECVKIVVKVSAHVDLLRIRQGGFCFYWRFLHRQISCFSHNIFYHYVCFRAQCHRTNSLSRAKFQSWPYMPLELALLSCSSRPSPPNRPLF